MADNEKLLKLDPHGALVNIINDENRTIFNGGTGGELEFSDVRDAGGVRTTVKVSVRDRYSHADSVPAPGELDFTYNRLDVLSNLGGFLSGWRPTLPTSTWEILKELTNRTGLVFYKEDFIQEDIIRQNAAPYLLKAQPDSLRWTGSMSLTLVDLIDLGSYLEDGVPQIPPTLDLRPGAIPNHYIHPYLNGTSSVKLLDGLTPGATTNGPDHPLARFLQETVPDLGVYLMADDFQDYRTNWVYDSNDGSAVNSIAAIYRGKSTLQFGLNPLLPSMTSVVNIELSMPGRRLNRMIQVPYRDMTFDDSNFNDTPRLRCVSVRTAVDGTPWNVWLNGIAAPSEFPPIPFTHSGGFRPTSFGEWVNDPLTPSPTNLHRAVVQYNGERRAQDPEADNPDCNRVLSVILSDHNTAFEGTFTFHYRAPIIIDLPGPMPVNTDIAHALNPREGEGPYTITVVSGDLAVGHQLVNDSIIGRCLTLGRHRPVVDVTDQRGVTVRYSIQYDVVWSPVVLTNAIPVAQLDVPWSYTFELAGGVPPFTYELADAPPGFDLSRSTRTISGTFTGSPGIRYLSMDVSDASGRTTRVLIPVTVI